MLIRLEFENRTIHETTLAEMSEEIVIGRGKECAWRITGNDPVVSSKHAALFRKGKALWIRDLESKNGTFYRGRRIIKMKLRPGARIGIGNHALWVEEERKGVGGKAASEVVVLTGKSRGQKRPIQPPCLTIGSDPGCGLTILDTLISRRHAEISLKEDGSCWIRDLGSKNGTSVNGLPMRDDKERLLKDGDRIGVAHLELEFHDGAVRKSSSQAWLRMGIVLATLAVCLTLYWTYKLMRPSAESHIVEARNLASTEEFAAARQELEKAVNARHADAHEVELEDMRRSLTLWETTLGAWTTGEKALETGNWVEASRQLGMLQAGNKDAWTWNEKAVAEKERAVRAKKLLDALLHATSSLRREDATVADLRTDLEAVKEGLAASANTSSKSLFKLRADLDEAKGKLEAALAESGEMEAALDLLKEPFPPYEKVVAILDKVKKTSDGSLRRRAFLVYDPLAGLAKSFAQLNGLADLARSMEFGKVEETQVDIPSPDACAVDSRVSQARGNQESILDNLKRMVSQVAYLHKEIDKRMAGGTIPPGIEALENAAVMSKVLACDSLDQPFPQRGRTKPVGEYDRLLGIEEFSTFLKVLPDPVDPALVSWPFPSLLTETSDVLKRIRELDALLSERGNQWLLGGNLGAEMKKLNAALARADALSNSMLARLETSSGRTALMLGGMALKLSCDPKKLMFKGKRLDAWLVAELKTNRNKTQEANNEFTLASLDRQIQIRDEILRTGLPGDPTVRRMWVMRSAVQER